MNKFSKYTADQLKWAATDIKETLDIWRGEPIVLMCGKRNLNLTSSVMNSTIGSSRRSGLTETNSSRKEWTDSLHQ
jgi:hypothetical protein